MIKEVIKQPSFIAGLIICAIVITAILIAQYKSSVDLLRGDSYMVTIQFYDNQAQLEAACEEAGIPPERNTNIYGCAFVGDYCRVLTVSDWEVLNHELRHCFEGAWHD